MSRKNATLLAMVIALVILGFSGLNYFLSFKTAYLNIRRNNVAVTVYNSRQQAVGELNSSGKLSLRTGLYSAVPSGDNINTTPIALKVTDRGAYLSVDPGYSQAYLNKLLAGQLSAIDAIITSTYSTVIKSFTVNNGSLYRYGDWYATTLIQASPGPGAKGDVYRTVLHEQDGVWKIAATPAIVLSTKDYPSIPASVLTNINAQSGY